MLLMIFINIFTFPLLSLFSKFILKLRIVKKVKSHIYVHLYIQNNNAQIKKKSLRHSKISIMG